MRMTKREILENLLILKELAKGEAVKHYKQSDSPTDYEFGYGEACDKWKERINALYDMLKEDVKNG